MKSVIWLIQLAVVFVLFNALLSVSTDMVSTRDSFIAITGFIFTIFITGIFALSTIHLWAKLPITSLPFKQKGDKNEKH